MITTSKPIFLLVVLWGLLGVGGQEPCLWALGSNTNSPPQKTAALKSSAPLTETVQVSVPVGTPFKVQLNQFIRTSTHRSGQPFFATLKEPVVVGGPWSTRATWSWRTGTGWRWLSPSTGPRCGRRPWTWPSASRGTWTAWDGVSGWRRSPGSGASSRAGPNRAEPQLPVSGPKVAGTAPPGQSR